MKTFEEYLKTKAEIDPDTEYTSAAMLQDCWDYRQGEIEELDVRLVNATSTVEIAIKALNFYAHGDYCYFGVGESSPGELCDKDNGETAQRALEKMSKSAGFIHENK